MLPDLLRAVDNGNKAYRTAALNVAEKITGIAATRQWIAKAQKANPELRAEIVGMLGRQGDSRALPFLQESLNAAEPQVSLAAAEALARIKGADVAADLLPLLKIRQGDDVRHIAEILLWTMDERHLDPLVAMFDSLQPTAKACAIGVVAARGGKRYAGKIIPLTADQNAEVKSAAFAALKDLVSGDDLPFLLPIAFFHDRSGPGQGSAAGLGKSRQSD